MTRYATSAQEIIDFLGARVTSTTGDTATIIRGLSPVIPGEPGTLSFISLTAKAATETLDQSASSVILMTSERFAEFNGSADLVICVDDPRREFARVVNEFFNPREEPSIHPTATISDSATIGQRCTIGAHAYIGDGVIIGDDCIIGPNTVVNVTRMGDRTAIGPNCTIGHVGFGYVREDDGTPQLLPHLGGVVIGNDVEIGANTCVDRGTMSDTIIENHAKIDNLVHVAHNCHIKEAAFVIAGTSLCGSVVVGPRAWMAPNSTAIEGVTIGADAVIGLGAVVIRNIPDGATAVGNPAKLLQPKES